MSYDKLEDTIQEAYKNVKLFNEIGGSANNISLEALALQMDLIQEEYLELVEAFDNRDDVEYLDAVCDLFVVLSGLMQKLEYAGFDVSGALKKVNENNLQKFPSGDDAIHYIPLSKGIAHKFKLDAESVRPPNTIKEYNSQYNVYVFKDKDTGKIKKPTNFVPVNLSGHEVKGFLSGSNKGGV